MLTQIIIKQGKQIIDLDKENKALYKENKELRFENDELQAYKNKSEKSHKDIMIDLLNLQEISRLGITESEKNKHRNVIINNIIKELDVRKTY